MLRFLLPGLLLFLSSMAHSQSFEWVKSEKINYSLNPSYLESPASFDKLNNHIVSSRVDSVWQIYGQTVYGPTIIESRDTAGQLLWQLPLNDKVSVHRMITGLDGSIYFGGSFQGTLMIGVNDTLTFINGTISGYNTFIIKLDSQGNVVWKKNLASQWSNYERIDALGMSPLDECWYAITDFFDAHIVRLDGAGNDLNEYTIKNGKTIGNICFDPWGGMFVSGGAENGNFIMNTDTFHVPHQYNMFIARFNPLGGASWAKFGADITFQRPVIHADDLGNVLFFGFRFDSTTFDNLFFTNPLPFGDFFGFKTDTSGFMHWKMQQPPLLIGPFGSFEPATNVNIGSDTTGNFYISGIHSGTVDWGNGFVSTSGIYSDRRIAVVSVSELGSVQWVKIGGSSSSNHAHALSVSDGGDCYFTGSFRDTAAFDTITINTANENNFVVGKISSATFTGLNDPLSFEMIVSPNPSHGEIFIPESATGSELLIFDVAGKVVYENKKLNAASLDLKDLSPGTYFLQFRFQQKVNTAKWIKIETDVQ